MSTEMTSAVITMPGSSRRNDFFFLPGGVRVTGAGGSGAAAFRRTVTCGCGCGGRVSSVVIVSVLRPRASRGCASWTRAADNERTSPPAPASWQPAEAPGRPDDADHPADDVPLGHGPAAR